MTPRGGFLILNEEKRRRDIPRFLCESWMCPVTIAGTLAKSIGRRIHRSRRDNVFCARRVAPTWRCPCDPAYSLHMAGNLHLLIVSHMVAFADTLPHTELSSSLTVLQAT